MSSVSAPEPGAAPAATRQEGGAPVAVAVVSWNTRALLIRCLESLKADVEAGRAEVWVVDNGSSDGSVEAVRDTAPWAHVLEPGENLGFGRAVNLVAARTSGPWLACANADVALQAGALERLLAGGEDPGIGCLAPLLELDGGMPQHSVHSLPTLKVALALNLGLPRLHPELGERMLLPGCYDVLRARDVPWAFGAFLLLRRAAFEAVGGYDDRQWMYAEDIDLCWRLGQAGWRIRYEPTARVLHASAAATEQAFGAERAARFMRASYGVVARRAGVSTAWATAAVNVLGAAARLAWLVPAAAADPRRRARRDEVRRWMVAHREGLRRPSALQREP